MTLLSDIIKAKASQFRTTTAAAEDYGVTQPMMSYWIRNVEVPSEKRISSLAVWCGVPEDEFRRAWEEAAAKRPRILSVRVRFLEDHVTDLLRRVGELEEKLRCERSALEDVAERSP